MNQALTDHVRMIDQLRRPLEWRGKWVLHHATEWHTVEVPGPMLPADYPASYYKVKP